MTKSGEGERNQKRPRGLKPRSGYLFKRGGVYYLQWRVNGETFVQSTGATNLDDAESERQRIMAPFKEREARDILEKIADKIASNDLGTYIQPPVTIKEAWTRYLKSKNRPQSGERTLEGYENHFKRFSRWMEKNHPEVINLRDVSREIADAYCDDMLAAKFKPSTWNQHSKLLDLVWSVLREPGRITFNPWAWDKKTRTGLARMKVNKAESRHRPIDPTQVNQLIDLAEGDFKDLFTLLAYTGQRLYDVVHLRWECVNEAGRIIELVQRKMSRRGEARPVQIPMLPPVSAVLDSRKHAGEYVFPDLVELYSRDRGSTLSKRIGDIFAKAKLSRTRSDANGGRGIAAYGAHSFRHAFVTNARAYGIPDGLISKITGHRTDEMLDHYTSFSRKLVSALAKKSGRIKEAKIETVPMLAPGVNPADLAKEIGSAAERLNAKTWKPIRDELQMMARHLAGVNESNGTGPTVISPIPRQHTTRKETCRHENDSTKSESKPQRPQKPGRANHRPKPEPAC